MLYLGSVLERTVIVDQNLPWLKLIDTLIWLVNEFLISKPAFQLLALLVDIFYQYYTTNGNNVFHII